MASKMIRPLLFRASPLYQKLGKRFMADANQAKRDAIKKKQMLFQIDDNIPVHLKGGFGDKALLGVTTAFIGIGMMGVFHTVYMLYTR